MVEGLVPALPSQDILTPVRQSKRRVSSKTFSDFKADKVLENYSIKNSKCFTPIKGKTPLCKYSFFPQTIIEWNNLEESVVRAKAVGSFRSTVLQWD
ncbi:hypothetical protein DPMN_161261 [Dreissena polymorpha]|uniref:Uncharacterized protein n=1 Tax=Dreissena polymorpha TaxID=45954 RepID=A0A9D4ENN6_DREPO|nr:hypothetical protein DPMN_161261 [Dreissena polymorpha]